MVNNIYAIGTNETCYSSNFIIYLNINCDYKLCVNKIDHNLVNLLAFHYFRRYVIGPKISINAHIFQFLNLL